MVTDIACEVRKLAAARRNEKVDIYIYIRRNGVKGYQGTYIEYDSRRESSFKILAATHYQHKKWQQQKTYHGMQGQLIRRPRLSSF